METLLQDLRFAIRGLLRSPGFTVAAVLTLALGIGANVAVFTVADAALFRPLPYRAAERLVDFMRVENPGTPRQTMFRGMTRDDISTWRAQSQIFEAIEAYRGGSAVVGDDNPERVDVTPDVGGHARLSGSRADIRPRIPSGGNGTGTDDVVIIGEGLWKARFGGDPAVLGRPFQVGQRSRVVIGIMPSSFRFPDKTNQIWVPLTNAHNPQGGPSQAFVGSLAKLRAGLTLAEAQQRVDVTSSRLQKERPKREGWTMRLVSVDESRANLSTRRTLLVLLGVVGFVLLIACVNVANLLLARSVARGREMAIRSAIGASRWQVVRLQMVEGLLIAVLGAAAAGVAATLGINALTEIAASSLPLDGGFEPEMNGRVLTFMAIATLLTGLACALVPALTSARANQRLPLLGASRGADAAGGARGIHRALASVEVALTFVLLLGAGLLANSFIRMVALDVGFNATNVVSITLELPQERYATPPLYRARVPTAGGQHRCRAWGSTGHRYRRGAAQGSIHRRTGVRGRTGIRQ